MTPVSDEPIGISGEVPTEDSVANSNEIKAAVESVKSTPNTIPLKRGVAPLFVPVVLPEESTKLGSEKTELEEAGLEKAELDTKPAGPQVEFASPPNALYQASLTLELRCSVAGATIYYSLDGSEVNEESAQYQVNKKILLTQTTTVTARAYADGIPGPVATGHFEIEKPQWQKLEPIDPSDPTTHEEKAEENLEGSWHLAAASLRGRLHAHRAGWREDAFRYGLAHAADGTYSIVIVSDGAGSAPLSRVASNLACQSALDSLSAALTASTPLGDELEELVKRDLPGLRAALVESAVTALNQVKAEADKRSRPLSDFSATLLILVRREWRGQQLCATLQAGDGAIALWNDDDTLTLLGEADHGQQSGETRFLTSNGMETEFPTRVKFSIRPALKAVAVMTDGVADDYFPEPERLPQLFQTLLPMVERALTQDEDSDNESLEPSPGTALLDWIDYEKKGSSDDRTLVFCWRGENISQTVREGNDGES